MSDGATVISDLEDLTSRLDTASRELYKLQTDFDSIAERYDDTFNDFLTGLLSEYEDEGKRLPGEDVRNAIITKLLREQEPLLFGQYRRMRKELDRGERRAKQIERQISSKQSILSYLRVESQAIGA